MLPKKALILTYDRNFKRLVEGDRVRVRGTSLGVLVALGSYVSLVRLDGCSMNTVRLTAEVESLEEDKPFMPMGVLPDDAIKILEEAQKEMCKTPTRAFTLGDRWGAKVLANAISYLTDASLYEKNWRRRLLK